MKRISEFLTKPVISLYDSKTEGIIKTVYFDKSLKKLKWFVIFDNEEHTEDCAIKATDVFSVGENAIVIRNDGCLNLEFSTITNMDKQSPINNNVYTTKGKFMGTVVDVEIDEKFNTKNIVLNNGEIINIKKVASSGTDALILQDDEKEIVVAKYKKRFPKIEVAKTSVVKIMNENITPETQTASNETASNEFIEKVSNETQVEKIINQEIKGEEIAPIASSTEQKPTNKIKEIKKEQSLEITQKPKPVKKYTLNEKNSVPNRISSNHNFLIGRTIEKNIYSVNKVLLAKKGTKITQKTIEAVNQHYKLRELIQFSK